MILSWLFLGSWRHFTYYSRVFNLQQCGHLGVWRLLTHPATNYGQMSQSVSGDLISQDCIIDCTDSRCQSSHLYSLMVSLFKMWTLVPSKDCLPSFKYKGEVSLHVVLCICGVDVLSLPVLRVSCLIKVESTQVCMTILSWITENLKMEIVTNKWGAIN